MNNLTKRQVRYWLFRFKTEAEGGTNSNGAPEGLREHFESQPMFGGWKKFAVDWDVNEDSPLELAYRNFSVWEEWDRVLVRVTDPARVGHDGQDNI